MITDEDLKPCPFCGKTETLETIHVDELRDDDCASDSDDAYTVICNYNKGGCGATCGFYRVRELARYKWNTRAESAEQSLKNAADRYCSSCPGKEDGMCEKCVDRAVILREAK